MQPIERELPVLVRLDFIKDDVPRTGQGELYRVYSGGTYKTFPFLMEREHDVCLRQSAPNRFREGVVERAFQVVDGITDDERNAIWDWRSGRHDHPARCPITIRANVNTVEALGAQSSDHGLKLMDVGIGPLNL
jgi:hypothetical protein